MTIENFTQFAFFCATSTATATIWTEDGGNSRVLQLNDEPNGELFSGDTGQLTSAVVLPLRKKLKAAGFDEDQVDAITARLRHPGGTV